MLLFHTIPSLNLRRDYHFILNFFYLPTYVLLCSYLKLPNSTILLFLNTIIIIYEINIPKNLIIF